MILLGRTYVAPLNTEEEEDDDYSICDNEYKEDEFEEDEAVNDFGL